MQMAGNAYYFLFWNKPALNLGKKTFNVLYFPCSEWYSKKG